MGREQINQKIDLFLAIEAFFLAARRKEVAIWSAPLGDAIGIGRQADFFLKFSLQRLLGRFWTVDSALRELPATGSIGSFAYQNPAVSPSDDRSDIRSIF